MGNRPETIVGSVFGDPSFPDFCSLRDRKGQRSWQLAAINPQNDKELEFTDGHLHVIMGHKELELRHYEINVSLHENYFGTYNLNDSLQYLLICLTSIYFFCLYEDFLYTIILFTAFLKAEA